MEEKERTDLALAVTFLALSLVLAMSLYSGNASASLITGAATQGSGTVEVLVIDQVIERLAGGGGGRAVTEICPETCEFGATRCYDGDMNICVPVFKYHTVCGVWMLIDCPGECSDGRCADCAPDWKPFPWSECSSEGIQFRSLVDYNSCYPDLPERTEYRECEPAPSCSDGRQNQNEEGVDCGGPCPACEYPAAVMPPEKEPKKPMYVCGDGACGVLEMCWGDCRTKMAAIPAALVALVSLMYLVPFALMNMGGDYSLYYTLKQVLKKVGKSNFASGNRLFMTKVEPRYMSFMTRYTSGKKMHRAIESIHAEAKMYLQAHEAKLSESINDKRRYSEAMKDVRKLAKRFEAEAPRNKKAYKMFKEAAESLKGFPKGKK